MTDEIDMIAEATTRIFADLADPQTLNAASGDGWKAPLWQALEEAGLTAAWVPEDKGGAGLPLDGGFEILRVSGHYAAPVPVAETMLAGWLLAEAGLAMPPGMLTVAPVRALDRLAWDGRALGGTARSVPHGAEAAHVVVAVEDAVLLFGPGAFTAAPRQTDMGGERADLSFAAAVPDAVADLPGAYARLERMGAAARASQMAGALETTLAMTTGYTGEREAFGRKIAKFQAVQQNLAQLAGEVAAAVTAAGSAADTLATLDHGANETFLEVAAAKIRVGEAVEAGAAIAHQAHGAIGWTQDYTLQRYTRRMWGWRDDFGTEADWAVRLGRLVSATGGDGLWPMLTTR